MISSGTGEKNVEEKNNFTTVKNKRKSKQKKPSQNVERWTCSEKAKELHKRMGNQKWHKKGTKDAAPLTALGRKFSKPQQTQQGNLFFFAEKIVHLRKMGKKCKKNKQKGK